MHVCWATTETRATHHPSSACRAGPRGRAGPFGLRPHSQRGTQPELFGPSPPRPVSEARLQWSAPGDCPPANDHGKLDRIAAVRRAVYRACIEAADLDLSGGPRGPVVVVTRARGAQVQFR